MASGRPGKSAWSRRHASRSASLSAGSLTITGVESTEGRPLFVDFLISSIDPIVIS